MPCDEQLLVTGIRLDSPRNKRQHSKSKAPDELREQCKQRKHSQSSYHETTPEKVSNRSWRNGGHLHEASIQLKENATSICKKALPVAYAMLLDIAAEIADDK